MKNKFVAIVLIFTMLFMYPTKSNAETNSFLINCDKIMNILSNEDASQNYVETGVVLRNFEEMKEFDKYFDNLYYNGNIYVFFVWQSTGDPDSPGNVYVKSNGSSRQAYEEHVQATSKIKEIARSIGGNTVSEKLAGIYDYVYKSVQYADQNTIDAVKKMNSKSKRNYEGIYATGYTAVMNGISTCIGYSSIFQRLCSEKGIPCAIIRNSTHAYNVVLLDGQTYFYDLTNDVLNGRMSISGKSYLELKQINEQMFKADQIIPSHFITLENTFAAIS